MPIMNIPVFLYFKFEDSFDLLNGFKEKDNAGKTDKPANQENHVCSTFYKVLQK